MRTTYLSYGQEMWWRKQTTAYLMEHFRAARENAPKAQFEADRLKDLAQFLEKEIEDRQSREAYARWRVQSEKDEREWKARMAEEDHLRNTHAE